MLSRGEVNSTIIPNISSLPPVSSSSHKTLPNLIHKSIFKGEIPVNIYLPNTSAITNSYQKSKPLTRRILINPIHQSKSEVNLDEVFLYAKSEECSKIMDTKDKIIKRMNDIFEKEKIKSTKHQRTINEIVNDVKKNREKCEKDRSEKVKKYFHHALKKKINPKSIDMLYSIEQSRNQIHLQKLILNVEYKNEVTNKKKQTRKEDKFNNVLNERVFNQVKEQLKNKNIIRSRNSFGHYRGKSFVFKTELTTSEKSHDTSLSSAQIRKLFDRNKTTHKTTLVTRIDKPKATLITTPPEINSEPNHEIQFDNDVFVEKYKSINNTIKNEKLKHYHKKVLSKDEIDFLTENKRDLLIQKLKDEYIEKYNKFLEKKLGKNIEKKNKESLQKYNPNIKESIFRRDENKLPEKTAEQLVNIKSKLITALDSGKVKLVKLNVPFKLNLDGLNFK